METLIRVVDAVSIFTIPLFLVGIPLYGLARGVKIYAVFVEGAKEGFATAIRILPYLVAVLAAVGAFRGAGAMQLVGDALGPIADALGVPTSVLPLMVVRPLSGSGANGLLAELLKTEGPDSLAGRLGSLVVGSSETTFYVLAVYFGSVGIQKQRHAVPAALAADGLGYLFSILAVHALFAR